MFAVVEIAGVQYKVVKDDTIKVPKLDEKPGTKVKFDKVLLVGDDKGTKIGQPLVKGMTIEGNVIDHAKADKVIVFKKKRRKGYRVKRGHRQDFTQVQITKIG